MADVASGDARVPSINLSAQLACDCAGMPSQVLVNNSINVADKLFASFVQTTDSFPLVVDASTLRMMLRQPPNLAVPVPQSLLPKCQSGWTDTSHPLFVAESVYAAPDVVIQLCTALLQQWPRGRPTEYLLTPAWTNIGMGFPEMAGSLLGVPIKIQRGVNQLPLHHTVLKTTGFRLPPHSVDACRGVREDSISGEDCLRRNNMAVLSSVPCVVGEDRALESLQQVRRASAASGGGRCPKLLRHGCFHRQVALSDAVKNYQAVNSMSYGRLRYILLVIMAGTNMAVYAMPLKRQLRVSDLVPLLHPQEVRHHFIVP